MPLLWLLLLVPLSVSAHVWTPTYPTWEQSYISGVVKVEMELSNRRKDASYYSVQVLDRDMNPVPFVTPEKVIHLPYLKKKKVEVYVRKTEMNEAVYICSVSRILKDAQTKAAVSTRICSKAK